MIDAFAILEDLARREGLDAGGLSVIELNRSGPSHASVALLVFGRGSPEPLALVKATSDADRAGALRREFDNLARLHRDGSERLSRSIPRPLYCEHLGPVTAMAESAIQGVRMKNFPPDRYFASARFREDFSQAVRWLDELRAALSEECRHSTPGAVAREVERYRERYDASPALGVLLDDTAAALADREVPLVPSHGDFCTANVVVPPGGGISVIDWEYPLTRTWPLADLLYFISSTWCVPYRKGREALEANYRRLFFAAHRHSELIRRCCSRYARQLGLDAGLMLPLSVMSWVAFANRKRDELAAAGGEETAHMPLIMTANDRCSNLEILAELRDRYLSGGA